MPKRSIKYQPWLQDRLKDASIAINYLRSVLRDSPELFPKALRKVADARGFPLSKIAESAGVERESLYRMLCESGNPTWLSLRGVVKALELDWDLKLSDASENRSGASESNLALPVKETTNPRSNVERTRSSQYPTVFPSWCMSIGGNSPTISIGGGLSPAAPLLGKPYTGSTNQERSAKPWFSITDTPPSATNTFNPYELMNCYA